MELFEIILYTGPAGKTNIEVHFEDETFWLSQKKMAELFAVDVRTISEHLNNIFNTNELDKSSTIRNFRIVQKEGSRNISREVDFYNLDAIIAVGYRVNSIEATRFRIWATKTLREFIIKGFVLDDERLKQGKNFGKDYFEELLERIHEIRASERRFYQKITDIYAQCSSDYDPKSTITQTFYKTVQNKLHWAITGHTAAELIAERANAAQPNMGLTNWKNAPDGKISRADVTIAKNYLSEKELSEFNRIVSMYLEDRLHVPRLRRKPSQTPDPYDHERMVATPRCFLTIQRIRHPQRRRQHQRRHSKKSRRDPIRTIPDPPGPGLPFRFRSGN
jgi:hypothetical protein